MSAYLIPAANKTACEAIVGPLAIGLVNDTGTVTTYLTEWVNATPAIDAQIIAAGGTVYTNGAAALAATTARRSKAESVSDTIRTKAAAAIATNVAWKNTVTTRANALTAAKATATTGSTATIANVAAAQTAIRQIASMLVNVITLLQDLSAQSTAAADQSNAVIRLLIGQLDAVD